VAKKGHSGEQILRALRQAESGTRAGQLFPGAFLPQCALNLPSAAPEIE
jgi:hypothetical protein